MSVSSSNLKVGDIIVVEKGVRVPADLVLLRYITLTFLWKPLFNLNITGSELVQELTVPRQVLPILNSCLLFGT